MRQEIRRFNHSEFLSEGMAVLDITASSRYWRTSRLEEVSLMLLCQGTLTEVTWISEREADEYELLQTLSKELQAVRQIVTYNGTAFDLPHLKHKYEAYGLEDPFHQKEYRDLFLEYQPLYTLLGLPSRRLRDYAEFLKLDPAEKDVYLTMRLLELDSISRFFKGGWSFERAWRDEDHLYYQMNTTVQFPVRMSFHDEIYHLILEDHSALLSVQLIDGKIRRYYTDVKHYVYLPLEGYAIHKSMAGFVVKEHKEKAVRSNCFSVTAYSDLFLTDETRISRYLITALLFLQSR